MDNSPLARLPLKLRTRIYNAAFGYPIIRITKASPNHVPGVLQTCHQLRTEALPLFYSEAQFHVKIKDKKGGVAWKWINSLSKEAAAAITHFEIHVETSSNGAATESHWQQATVYPDNKRDEYIRIITAIQDCGFKPAAVEWTMRPLPLICIIGTDHPLMRGEAGTNDPTYQRALTDMMKMLSMEGTVVRNDPMYFGAFEDMVNMLQVLTCFGDVFQPHRGGFTGIVRMSMTGHGSIICVPGTTQEEKKIARTKLKEIEALRSEIRRKS